MKYTIKFRLWKKEQPLIAEVERDGWKRSDFMKKKDELLDEAIQKLNIKEEDITVYFISF